MNEHRQLKLLAQVLGKTESVEWLLVLPQRTAPWSFVRQRGIWIWANRLHEQIDAVNRIWSGFNTNQLSYQQFDPSQYDNTIVLAIPSALQYRVGSELLVDLLETFPKARIKLVDWKAYSKNDIIKGSVDIGIHYFNSEFPKSIDQQELDRPKSAIATREGIDTTDVLGLLNMPYLLLNTKGRGDVKGASDKCCKTWVLRLMSQAL